MNSLYKVMKNTHKERLLKKKQEAIEIEEKIAAMALLVNRQVQLEKMYIERRQTGRKLRSDKVTGEFYLKAAKEIELFTKE